MASDTELTLRWGDGGVEVFPRGSFQKVGTFDKWEIPIYYPEGVWMERCKATVAKTRAILNYGGKHKRFNERWDFYIGETRINFTNEARSVTSEVSWRDVGDDEFYDWQIESSWASLDHLKPPGRKLNLRSRKRRSAMRMVPVRMEQPWLRSILQRAYRGRCAMSGTNVPECLEVAHIVPFADDGVDDPRNALLLRSDIHALFDTHLIVVEPQSRTVRVHTRLRAGVEYGGLHNKRLLEPASGFESAKEALDFRYAASAATSWVA